MESVGGLFMIQDLQPRSLIGSLQTVAPDIGAVHVYVSFFPEREQLCLEHHTSQRRLCMSRMVALQFVALLHVQLAVMTVLQRSPSVGPLLEDADRAIQVAMSDEHRDTLVAAWITGTPGMEDATEEGQTTLRIRRDRVLELAHGLTRELARVATSH